MIVIKNIEIMSDKIIIVEEKKGIFGIKENTVKFDISIINKIERIIQENKLIGIVIWNNDEVLYGIGIKNYDKNLEDIYNQITNNIQKDIVKIVETRI